MYWEVHRKTDLIHEGEKSSLQSANPRNSTKRETVGDTTSAHVAVADIELSHGQNETNSDHVEEDHWEG